MQAKFYPDLDEEIRESILLEPVRVGWLPGPAEQLTFGLDLLRSILAPARGRSLTDLEKVKEARVLVGLLGKRTWTMVLSLLLFRILGGERLTSLQ